MPPNNHQKIIGKVTDGGREFPIIVVEIINNNALPSVLLSAGIHGNEIASITALEEFINGEINTYAKRFNFIVLPCINPVGRARNTRGNGSGVDLNRNFFSGKPEEEVRAVMAYLSNLNKKFCAAIDMHEDVTEENAAGYDSRDIPRGFYLYEISDEKKRIGKEIIAALRAEGFSIAANKIIYGKASENGLVWYPPSARESLQAGSFTDSFLLGNGFTDHVFVTETPTCWPFGERVRAQKKTLALILENEKWPKFIMVCGSDSRPMMMCYNLSQKNLLFHTKEVKWETKSSSSETAGANTRSLGSSRNRRK